MKTNILLLFLLLSCAVIHAQYDEWTPAKVVLKNGASFRGYVKLPKHSGGLISIGSTKFKFRKKRKSTTEKYGHEDVSAIVFGDEAYAILKYVYVPINKSRYVLMEEVVNGKARLFLRTVSQYEDISVTQPYLNTHVPLESPVFENFDDSIHLDYYYDDFQFYVIRDNEEVATLLAGPNSFRNLELQAKLYFADCDKVVDYLNHEIYSMENIHEIVEDYNLLCDQ